jgi:hypothetical protein
MSAIDVCYDVYTGAANSFEKKLQKISHLVY